MAKEDEKNGDNRGRDDREQDPKSPEGSEQGESDGDGESDRGDDQEGRDRRVSQPASHYLKLGATFLLTLIIFTALVRGLASCQDKDPFTGEPVAPPPPPPPASQALLGG
jgi:hypothetical protein